MPNESQDSNTKLILDGPSLSGRIHVDTEAFFELSFWLAEELENLVSRWRHVAPGAHRTPGNRDRLPLAP